MAPASLELSRFPKYPTKILWLKHQLDSFQKSDNQLCFIDVLDQETPNASTSAPTAGLPHQLFQLLHSFQLDSKMSPQSSLPLLCLFPPSPTRHLHISAVCQVAWCSAPSSAAQGCPPRGPSPQKKNNGPTRSNPERKPEQTLAVLGPEARLFFQSSARGWL